MFKAVFAIAAALGVAGCGGSIFSLTVDPPGKTREYFANCLRDNHFLDGAPGKFNPSLVATRLAEGVVHPQVWPMPPSASGAQPSMTIAAETDQLRRMASGQPGYVHLFLDC